MADSLKLEGLDWGNLQKGSGNMPKSLTPKEFLERMKEIEIYQNDDTETAHSEADKLMCSLLRSLGYGAGVKVFEKKMEKWYA